jgi:hypothetical protein
MNRSARVEFEMHEHLLGEVYVHDKDQAAAFAPALEEQPTESKEDQARVAAYARRQSKRNALLHSVHPIVHFFQPSSGMLP